VAPELCLDVRGVRVSFSTVEALKSVTLEFSPGDFLGIVGPNGSGKSTLLKTMARSLSPREGVVLLDGRDVSRWPPKAFAQRVAVLPQQGYPAFDYTAREIVEMGRTPHEDRFGRDPGSGAVEDAMKTVGLNGLENRRLSQLSGGERQLVALARALAQEPEILLLDEPTNYLDLRHRVAFMNTLRKLNAAGTTVLMVMHDLNLAAAYARRIVMLKDGWISAAGPPSAVLTPETLGEVFEAETEVFVSPLTSNLHVHPLTAPEREFPNSPPRVHVICGGGSGSLILRRLYEEGVSFSTGILTETDPEYPIARTLEARIVESPPYSPIPDDSYRRNVSASKEAGVVVVCGMPVGTLNLPSLKCVLKVKDTGAEVIMAGELRDHTGGEASELGGGAAEGWCAARFRRGGFTELGYREIKVLIGQTSNVVLRVRVQWKISCRAQITLRLPVPFCSWCSTVCGRTYCGRPSVTGMRRI
jgi:iron complex transport system ATP-binding protein